MTLAKEFRADMHQPKVAQRLRKAYESRNFMTPEIVAVFSRQGLTFEVSAGDWRMSDTGRIYGVSVWGPDLERLDPDPSAGGFRSLMEAWALVEKILAEVRA